MKNLKNWKVFNEGIHSYQIKGKGITLKLDNETEEKIVKYVFDNFKSSYEGTSEQLEWYKNDYEEEGEFYTEVFDLFTPLEAEGFDDEISLTYTTPEGKDYLENMIDYLNLDKNIQDLDINYIA